MVGGQYVDVTAPDDLERRRAAPPARAQDRSADRRVGRLRTVIWWEEGSATIALRRFAAELGVLFQIVDDILDVTGDEAALGKPRGSDERHGKRTYVSVFGLDGRASLAGESHAKARAALAEAGGQHRQSSSGSPTTSSPARRDPAPPRQHRRPRRPQGPRRRPAPAGGPGGARADHRHDRRDRRPLRRQPRHLRARRWPCTACSTRPRDKVLWDVGHQAYPHKVLTGRRDQLRHDPQVRRPRALLLDPRVRARHHGRRPRLHLGLLRRRPQGGHAPGPGRGRQGRRRDRRRRADRRRGLRGAAQRRRHGPADRDRAQRQRHVDRAERRRAVALLQPRPAEPQAAPARARTSRRASPSCPPASASASSAWARSSRSRSRPTGRRGCSSRSSTWPTWA